MNASLVREIKKIIKRSGHSCSVSSFEESNPIGWHNISRGFVLSEAFMRYFSNKIDWNLICTYQKLSEKFMREFNKKISYEEIGTYQKLSEKFIRDHRSKFYLYDVLKFQKLSEKFIRELVKGHAPVGIDVISSCQNLSEKFILDHKNKLNWHDLFYCQSLNESFFKNAPNKISFHWEFKKPCKSLKQKKLEIQAYAKKHKLKFDGKFLYAYRRHDLWGRGSWNKTIFYKVGKYYKDWHCDLNENIEDSFGLGIWPKTRLGVNTLVKVAVKDWGCAVLCNNGKSRVWGFTVVEKLSFTNECS